MDKEKEIEEMEDFISKNKRVETSEWIANGLYDMGYRKIIPNVDFVVRCCDLVNVREKAYNDARKETAREIYKRVNKWLDEIVPHTREETILICLLGWIKTKYGIEVDE